MKIQRKHFSGMYYQKFKQVGAFKQSLFRILIDSRQPVLRVLKKKFSFQSKLLDFGCGTGLFAYHASLHFDYFGIDFSKDAILTAKKNVSDAKFAVGSLSQLKKIPSDSVDVITCFDVLEHIRDFESYLDQFWRILSPTGWLVSSSPIVDSLSLKIKESGWLGFEDPSHIRLISRGEWKHVLLNNGFIPLRIYSSGIINSPTPEWRISGWLRLLHYISQPLALLGFSLPAWATDEDYYVCIKNPHFKN